MEIYVKAWGNDEWGIGNRKKLGQEMMKSCHQYHVYRVRGLYYIHEFTSRSFLFSFFLGCILNLYKQ